MSVPAHLYVKARPGETVTDDKMNSVTERGGNVPNSSFWRRRLKRGEILLVTLSPAKSEAEPVEDNSVEPEPRIKKSKKK